MVIKFFIVLDQLPRVHHAQDPDFSPVVFMGPWENMYLYSSYMS
jgi:hypothetical protein